MIHHPDAPHPLTYDTHLHIERQMSLTARAMAREAQNITRQDYYSSIHYGLPEKLRTSIRGLVCTAYANKQSESKRLHPYAVATEQGIVVGTRFAKKMLPTKDYASYCDRLVTELDHKKMTYEIGLYDLGDVMRFNGYKTIQDWGEDLSPLIGQYRPDAPFDPANDIYLNALGFAVELAEATLVTRVCQTPGNDKTARHDIESDINSLGSMALDEIVYFLIPNPQ